MVVSLPRQKFKVEQRFSVAAEFQGFMLFIQFGNASFKKPQTWS
jgi:hypothetical protein